MSMSYILCIKSYEKKKENWKGNCNGDDDYKFYAYFFNATRKLRLYQGKIEKLLKFKPFYISCLDFLWIKILVLFNYPNINL